MNVLAPKSTHQHNTTGTETRLTPCDCCEIEGHSLSRSEKLAVYRLTINELWYAKKQNFVLDFYALATKTRDCRWKHTGGICKGNTLPVCMMMYHNKQKSENMVTVFPWLFQCGSLLKKHPSHKILTHALHTKWHYVCAW